jgi:Ca2+-binding RTX toxin-like protein
VATNYITGTSANEVLTGTSANDVIDGKGGSDLMRDYSTTTNDTYVFGVGYGQPNITDYGGNDTILFGAGIKASDIKFYLTSAGYLMPRISDSNDKPEISYWPDPKFQIENWVFQDGTVLTNTQVSDLIDYSRRVVIYTSQSDTIANINGSKNLIYLMQGDDVITCSGADNIVELSKGNDTIYLRGTVKDEIYMGAGTDYAEDDGANVRYIYNKGDGQDVIYDKGGTDTVKFGRTVEKSNLVFSRSGDDLVVSFKNTSYDKLTIRDWVKSSSNKIENFEMWDGSKISALDVDKLIGIVGPDFEIPNPTITGTDAYDRISTGNSGDDVYYLKKGNDRVMDYTGNDTYLFYRGDGQDNIGDQQGTDTIILAGNILKGDVAFSKDPLNSENLLISIKGTNDSINVNKWYRSAAYKIENLFFSDGTRLSSADIENIITPPVEKPVNITGTDTSETLTGNDLNNIIQGKKGNDVITDVSGNDTYIFNSGDGQDVITDGSGTDSVKFGAGITKDDLDFSKSGNNMVVKINGTSDKITIQNWYSSASNKLETFLFADNTTLSIADAEKKALDNWAAYGFAPTITGTDAYERISTGNSGNDIYYLKKGNDRVMDYTGNDTYLFNKGNGQDNIGDYAGTDSIVFGIGVAKGDISFKKDVNNALNLVMSINGTNDSINVNNWYRSASNQIEKVQFLDGTYFTNNEINQIIQGIASYTTGSDAEILSADTTTQQNLTLVTIG